MIRPYPSFPARAAVLLLLAPLFAQSAAGPPAKDYSFTVKAKMPWNDTKLNLKKGDLVHVYGGVLVCAAPVPRRRRICPFLPRRAAPCWPNCTSTPTRFWRLPTQKFLPLITAIFISG